MSVNDIRTAQTTDLFEVMPGESECSKTFIFGNEDHTLGNALRYVIMQQPETSFCGYSVPHPYEPKMNIRLQTNVVPAIPILKRSLTQLELAADQLDATFTDALNDFRS